MKTGQTYWLRQAHGSGKTAVLVERIINKIINKNIDIDKLLVVTFTNAAAQEMRERVLDAIYSKLEANPEDQNLQRQITLINKASICTIDSFCLDVIKNNFFETDISPNFRVADSAEVNLLKQDILEQLFENEYEAQDDGFKKLVTTYTSYKNDAPLKELILKIHRFIQSNPFPNKWLEEKVQMFNLKEHLDTDFVQTPWGKLLLQELEEELIDDILMLQKARNVLAKEPDLYKYEGLINSDIEMLQNLKLNLDSWDKAYEISTNLEFPRWISDRKLTYQEKDEAKKIRDDVRAKLKKKLAKILAFNSTEANQDICEMYETLNLLKNIILKFDEEFANAKKEKNILDFNDIEHFALKILLKEDEDGNYIPSEVAKNYQEKFNEIAIDEYQDSNLVQECILTSIQKNNNIFMVGDVKQSIYKFRQARPELFIEKYATYKLKKDKKEGDNLKIQLFKNFRSRQGILDFTNLIFENIMSSLLGDIEYNEDEFLNLGADYETPENVNLKTEIDIINLSENSNENEENEAEEELESAEIEAKFVAKKIKEIVENKAQLYDTKAKSFRNIEYKDIVVLLRSTKDLAPIFEKEMLNLEMPVFCDTSAEYLDSIEIQTVMSVLKIIDNPINDIPLIIAMRSVIGGFTDNDLVQIRLSDKYDNFYNTMLKAKLNVNKTLYEKIENFTKKIEAWRKEKEYLGLDELIWKIYTETGYYNYVGLMPNGSLRQANLKKLFERAKQYENASFKGLYNFINFIEKLHSSSGDLDSAKLIGENENVIRIMSIHKSKGLEFPVVFISSTGKQFNFMDLNSNVLLHHDMGFGVKYIDYEKQIEYDTLSKASIRNKMLQETLSEEMRVLYVALTRAKEKLYITGVSKDAEGELNSIRSTAQMYEKTSNKINPVQLKKYKRYIDWILLASIYDEEKFNKLATINIIDKTAISLENKEDEPEISVTKLLDSYEEDKEEINKIKSLLEFRYKYDDAKDIPTKTSVTSLKQIEQELDEKQIYLEDVIQAEEPKPVLFAQPNFIRENKEAVLTSAQKGTLIHLCLQKLDYRRDYDVKDIKNLVQELQAKRIITEVEADAININKVFGFTKSHIWEELKSAKEVYQEKPFYITIPAKEIYGRDIDENILVQGIIDLYYIDKDDNLNLVDYKTDFVEIDGEKELVRKYKKQLEIYSRALESALHKKVNKVYIYSTYLGKAIDINR